MLYLIYESCPPFNTKVGIAKSESHIKDRLTKLQNGNPRELKVFCVLPNAGRDLEQQVLDALDAWRLRSEWLQLAPWDVLQEICELIGHNWDEASKLKVESLIEQGVLQ